MKLSLSSAAAPELDLAGLAGAARQRGFAALELVADHAHGVAGDTHAETTDLARQARFARAAGVPIAGLYLPADAVPEPLAAAAVSAALAAPLVVPAQALNDSELGALVDACEARGGRLLLTHPTDPSAIAALCERLATLLDEVVGAAWEIDPRHDDPALIPAVLTTLRSRLCYIRFRGGGPEAAQQTGLGVGALMARLALARFAGPLVLMPSTPRYHYIWRAWLGRAGGWGCGSKQADASLVSLG